MTKEQKFYKALQDVFIGARIEGEGGFVNLMRIKSNYYCKIEDILKNDIEAALSSYPTFRDELFDKLYSFFSRYFTESGSIYFNSTPFHNNIYEKVYTDEKDVILFWKTQMLYYVKTDRIFRSLPVEFDGFKFYFDASKIESKKANEKRSLIFELSKVGEDGTIVFGVQYSERGAKTKQDEILKAIKRKGIAITEEQLERAFRVFEKQSEVDFFINKNAKAFLQEQFKLWSYQYFWEGAQEWSADRVNQLQILKDIAFKIIDFISQFEDELVKIWNKPKFVKNSNYVITLDRIYSPSVKGWLPKADGVVKWFELPFNPDLKERAKELRKAGNLSEVLLWNQIKNKQVLGLDFDRQKIIGNYIVDFYCKNLGIVIEIDGESHNEKVEYDKERDTYLKGLGLKAFHIQDIDVKKNLNEVIEFLKRELENTPSLRDTPLQEGNLIEKILKHPGMNKQIKEWGELGIVDEGFVIEDVFESDLTGIYLSKKYEHLPIDTKYFKDLELEILSQSEDLDKTLDGWLIKSENYQALNTILPKFKEKVQTIYIDPPFNTGDDFNYVDRFQDSSWLSLMYDRISVSKQFLNKSGSIFIHLDHNAEHLGRILLDYNFKNGFINNLAWSYRTGGASKKVSLPYKHDSVLFFAKDIEEFTYKPIYERQYLEKSFMGAKQDEEGRYYTDTLLRDVIEGVIKDFSNNKVFNTRPVLNLSNEFYGFKTQKPEGLLYLLQYITSKSDNEIILDYFAGAGTSLAVAQKLNKKWIGIEMGEYISNFYVDNIELNNTEKNKKDLYKKFVVLNYEEYGQKIRATVKKVGILGRLKQVVSVEGKNEPCGITEDIKWKGGGFFKYYELEQYEEALANCKYEDGDLFNSPLIKGWTAEGRTGYLPGRSPYQEYVFMKDEKMLKALEIDYENDQVKVDLSKLYPDPSAPLGTSIDIAETLSNLTGKWINKISDGEVEFEDGTKIDTKDLDYKIIKPLIWW